MKLEIMNRDGLWPLHLDVKNKFVFLHPQKWRGSSVG